MEFNEQTYGFQYSEGDDEEEGYSTKECELVMSTMQSVLNFAGESDGAELAESLRKELKNDPSSFLERIEKLWASLRSENGITLHLPVSLLSFLAGPDPTPLQTQPGNEELDHRFSLEVDGSGGLFLKRRDGDVRFPLQRTIFDIDNEKEWLPYVFTSVNRIFNNNKKNILSNAAIAWSPALTKYVCTASSDSLQLQRSSYTFAYSKTPQAFPVVVCTKRFWAPVSERTIFELPKTGGKDLVRKLADLLDTYQSSMKSHRNGNFLAERIAACGKKIVPLPGFHWPLAISFLPCLAGFQSLNAIMTRSSDSNSDSYREPIDLSAFKELSSYEALKNELRNVARKQRRVLKYAKPPMHIGPEKTDQAENAVKTAEAPLKQEEGDATLVKQAPGAARMKETKAPVYKVLPDKLSQLKAISMTHTILDRPVRPPLQASGPIREKVVTAAKEQVQMEAAVRTVYNPPDRTAELASLVSGIRQGGGSRTRAIEQLTPSIRSIMDARRSYLHQKLKAGSSQHAALQLWDTFHDTSMPPNKFAELLLNIESELELYTFYGIFRDIVYGMYLGMDTRGHLQLLCTSVQSYFSYELYAESAEDMKKRNSVNPLLVNTNESRDKSKAPDTWINHYQTLLREIFGLLKEGTQTQIKQVIRFEEEFLTTVGPI